MQLLGEGHVGGEPLVESHEEDDVVSQPHGEEEDWSFFEPHGGPQQGPHEVPNNGEMVRRVGHLGEPPLPTGHPLAVDLELQAQNRRHENVPEPMVERPRDGRRDTDGQEEAGDPRREEEVDSYRVVVLATDGFEVEDDL